MKKIYKINILHLIKGAKKVDGITVIIDVFRAFTTACYVFNNGAKNIIPVDTLEKAYNLKKRNSDYILIGERNGKPPENFNYGNSPYLIKDIDFKDRIVIQTTSAGTKGIIEANKADEIITGSFVNAKAIAEYISNKILNKYKYKSYNALNEKNTKKIKIKKGNNFKNRKKSYKGKDDINNFKKIKVSLVCMGNKGIKYAKEDFLCAKYIVKLIKLNVKNYQINNNNKIKKLNTNKNINKENLNINQIDSEKVKVYKIEDFKYYNKTLKDIELITKLIKKLKKAGKRFFVKENQNFSPKEDFYCSLDINKFDFIIKYKEGKLYRVDNLKNNE